jgi:hypothetical protein
MPSIFIWKSNELCTSKKQVRYYSGSNWFLEDNDFSSKSYMLIDQTVINDNNNQVITFHAKKMPQDWVGSELLEVTQVPYEQIKSDNYGTLERVGEWMRFISVDEFDSETLQNELIQIKKWIAKKDIVPNQMVRKVQSSPVKEHHNSTTTSKFVKKPDIHKVLQQSPFSSDNIQHNFQEFLNKYNVTLPMPETLLNQNILTKHDNNVKSNANMHHKSSVYKKRYNK